jgi:hypothetical protein
MERLHVMSLGSVQMESFTLDDKLDLMLKLWLYRQTEDFLYKNTIYLCTLESQVQHAKSYRRMTGYSYD